MLCDQVKRVDIVGLKQRGSKVLRLKLFIILAGVFRTVLRKANWKGVRGLAQTLQTGSLFLGRIKRQTTQAHVVVSSHLQPLPLKG